MEDNGFRTELRSWLEESVHEVGKAPSDPAQRAAWTKRWQKRLADGGWAAPAWPREYGGRSATREQLAMYAEELGRAGMPSSGYGIAIGFVGPTIFTHGTEEQKRRYLPKILSGEEEWCQLFSEPGAGSDLAGLQTRAERHGDEWVVNGQKVWTSGAVGSDFGILVARTDFDATKHRGITYFICPMKQPGIEIRPLRQITGDAHFNEVFLTDARVPDANIVGELNGGWGVAMTTFMFERSMIGGMGDGGGGRAGGFDALVALARAAGRLGDPAVRGALADNYIRSKVIAYLGQRVQSASKAGKPAGPESSVMKLAHALQVKRTGELALALQGAAGALAGADAPDGGAWQQSFLSGPSIRIAGGSDEIQRNIIGERFLGLPAEPRVDKDVPFRELVLGARR